MMTNVDLRRRSFLRWSALSGVGLMLGWRFILPAGGGKFERLRTLSQSHARLLAAVYATVTGLSDTQEMQRAVAFMDRFIGRISSRDRLELKAGLTLLEHSPLFFNGFFPRFTKLDSSERTLVLEGWRDGANWRRPLFGALKDLSYLARYTDPASWSSIGYTGPLVPIERQAGARDLEYFAMLSAEERGMR